ncbi:hypothetical protein [Methylobacterium gregans]|uniref:Uncharacterized protein n=1 Tax=Methylobacterium gregans TaxID=374424 RepID=A0AA37HP95_9HYPH|nr:hypothetical protein [Methylobacterium gregans]MDQ0521142.1 hypothetical protein [Methylobacterium gregans]GJD79130.1 hypothetical protein NBEOAGPD_2351 [Methylobacterium gregans]GLS54308.1 hypothetical protein GCM10007886_24910 [Methylobacterium gregans]
MNARRLLHTGPDGGRWSLARAGAEVFVLHEPTGGGAPERIGLARFLDGDPGVPQRRALLDLVATLAEAALADGPANEPMTGAPPEAGAAAAEPSPGEAAV